MSKRVIPQDAREGKFSGSILPCDNCGKEIYFYPYELTRIRRVMGRFCSRRCVALWHHANDALIQKKCEMCGKSYQAKTIAKTYSRFCSDRCQKRYTNQCKDPVPQTCLGCGKEFYRQKYNHRKYCSHECYAKNQQLDTEIFRSRNVRGSLLRRRPPRCEHCGYDEHPEILVGHHSQGRCNGHKDTLELLCPNCHAIEHIVKRRGASIKPHKFYTKINAEEVLEIVRLRAEGASVVVLSMLFGISTALIYGILKGKFRADVTKMIFIGQKQQIAVQ
jgi:endogenous inhibitor of DNA gyrase (YacG/DUF329 family)